MKNTNLVFCIVILTLAFYSCDKNSDYETWGNFELVVEMEKSNYKLGEDIFVRVYFSNIGDKTIQLDGILPFRNSANPPYIHISSNEGDMIRVNKFLDELNNENSIYIEPNNFVNLMQINLKDVAGSALNETNMEWREVDNIGTLLSNGVYYLNAAFDPTPQYYWSNSDTIKFYIE